MTSSQSSAQTPIQKPSNSATVIDLTVQPDAEPSSPALLLKTSMGQCAITSPISTQPLQSKPTVQLLSATTGGPTSTDNLSLQPQPTDQLSPSNFLEICNCRILKRKVLPKLPKYVQEFK